MTAARRSKALLRAAHRRVFAKPSTEKLVLTLLVKNEADVILENIFFHYASGVDHVVVTDNGSTDGTLQLLERLEQKGLVTLRRARLYNQDRLVNAMGRVARQKIGATILLHSDADEFWTPVNSTNLKDTFLRIGLPSLHIKRRDILPSHMQRMDEFPQEKMVMITGYFEGKDVPKLSKTQSYFLFKPLQKVMFSVKDKLHLVSFGNHRLTDVAVAGKTDEIIGYHFPFKSARRFTEKVVQGGQAFEKITTKKIIGWHWKYWYKQYKRGKFERELELLIPDLDTVAGISYEPFSYQQTIIGRIKTSRKYWRNYRQFVRYRQQLLRELSSKKIL